MKSFDMAYFAENVCILYLEINDELTVRRACQKSVYQRSKGLELEKVFVRPACMFCTFFPLRD